MDFRLPFKRLDDLPTYRNRGPMSTLRAFFGTFKRLDDLPTYRSGGAIGDRLGSDVNPPRFSRDLQTAR